MRYVETIPGMGEEGINENYGRGESKLWYTVRTL
jgi:hypothetical protein